MPYIAQALRRQIEPVVKPLCDEIAGFTQAGVLNYAITRLVLAYIGPKPSYGDYNAAIGALEGAKLELYRKQVGRHEDAALVQNGPVQHVEGTCEHEWVARGASSYYCKRCAAGQ